MERPALSRILGSFDESAFFRDHWGRAPLLLQKPERNRFAGLFGLAELEEYLFVARPPAGAVQLVRQGQWPPLHMVKGLFDPDTYDVQALYNGLTSGYTVVLNAIHSRWPAARRLVTDLEDRLMAVVQTNVYFTGPNAQGFAIHQDEHDVFVLQTHGAKCWKIYDKPAPGQALADAALLYDVELGEGDMLYMPKGFPHAASTSGAYSIHVTVGVFPLTWHELAKQTLDRIAQQDARWSEPVPIPPTGGTAPTAADLDGRLRAGLAALGDLSPVLDSYRLGLSASARRKNPAPDGYLTTIAGIDDLDASTELERRPGVGCSVAVDAESARVYFMGEMIRTPARAAKALEFIAAHQRFRIADIDPTLTDDSKLVLARRLIKEGLLQVARQLPAGRQM
jgi:ribosomal protein L16 Arg81 hydroxylase